MPLDMQRSNRLSSYHNDIEGSLDTPPMSCGASSAWHCAVTQPIREHLAACELRAAGWTVYLPLHRVPPAGHHGPRIVPLFPRYLFVEFAVNDPWGAIARTRGVVSLITHGEGQPTRLPLGVVEDLIERTSNRGVVDDMPFPTHQKPLQAGRGVWRSLTALSEAERLAVLHRLFQGGTVT